MVENTAQSKPPKKLAFTQRRLADLHAPPSGRVCVWDTKVHGLLLQITDKGARSWYVLRKLNGRLVRMRIGSAEEIGVDDARHAAERINAQIREGIDPRAAKQQARQGTTLKDLFTHWLETYAKLHKRTWPDDVRQFNKYLAPFHARRLDALKTADIARWHGRMGQDHGPIQANRTLVLLATLYNAASKVGYNGPNPCKDVKRFPEQSRERYLLPNEIRPFLESLWNATKDKPAWRDYFLLCLFAGGRRGNIEAMRWDELDVDNGVWRVPGRKSKNKRTMTVPLPPEAYKVLLARHRTRNGSEWVFPSDGKTGHIVEPKRMWARILAGMRSCPKCRVVVGSEPEHCPKCQEALPAPEPVDLHIHDLRRSYGSWQAAVGASLLVIGRSLGHADQRATAVYSRLSLDPVRESAARGTAAMLEAARRELPDGTGAQGPLALIIDAISAPAEEADARCTAQCDPGI
jgi:integrase